MAREAAEAGRPCVTVLLDPDDDKAVAELLYKRCRDGSGSLVISPAPRSWSSDALAGSVFAALGVWNRRGSEPRSQQLFLDGLEPPPSEQPEQLELLWVPTRADQLRRRASRPRRTPRGLEDAVQAMCDARISDLYVLRAQVMPGRAWTLLASFAAQCEVHLHLVVHGRPPRREQLAALALFEVVQRSVADGHPRVRPWWSRPMFRQSGEDGARRGRDESPAAA